MSLGFLNYYNYTLKVNYPVYQFAVIPPKISIAFTSFETSEYGNWSNIIAGNIVSGACPTGNKYYNLTTANPIKLNGFITGINYIVSYWSKNGSVSILGTQYAKAGKTISGWTYYEHFISGVASLTVSGNIAIDELRFYPSASQMSTYTYEPAFGITSECDVNNKIIYYEYDSFGRLSVVRDEDKNILKKICYNYAGQQISCN